ncbi:MAG: hypothetical protein FWC55_09385 [Firmicutes bacterium]|nr:hypothetical protein [Bacillota bacterium]
MYILAIFFLFVPIGFAGISVLSGVHGGNGRWLPSVSAAFGDAIALNEPPGLFLIMYVWLAGAVSFVVRHIVRLMLFKRRILKVSRSVKDEMKLSALNDSVSKMGIKRKLC